MRFSFLVVVLTLPQLALATAIANGDDAPPEPVHQLLFDSGREGYPRYRIPALLATPRGTLLAFCEGRKDGGGLTGNIDIVVKRSRDQGRTWGPLEVVADDGEHTLGNPCPLIDHQTGTIWLPMTRSHGSDLESQIVAGTSRQTTRVLLTSSTDDGQTWSPLRDITSSVKSKSWTWYGTGPGTGIQLASGRLVVPSYHVGRDDGVYRSHVMFSDDHGRTWQAGGVTGADCGECYVVQRTDGSLYLNARTNRGTELRTISTSRDRGATWTAARFERQLYDPHCQACVIALPSSEAGQRVWLFSNPAGPGRRDLTVRASLDEGRSWPRARRLRSGDSQYSSLAILSDGTIGCLYDSWQNGNYRLHYTRFSLEWLLAGKP